MSKNNSKGGERGLVVELEKAIGEQEVRDGTFVASRKVPRTPPQRRDNPAHVRVRPDVLESEEDKDRKSKGEDTETVRRRLESPSIRVRAGSIAECCERQVPEDKDIRKRIRDSPNKKVTKKLRGRSDETWGSQFMQEQEKGDPARGLDKMKELRELMMGMVEEIRDLRKVVVENQNTKVEIKKSTAVLADMAAQIEVEEYAEILTGIIDLQNEYPGDRASTTRQRMKELEAENKRLGKKIENLQKENKEIRDQLGKREETGDGVMEALLNNGSKTWKDCADVLSKKISESRYKNAFWATGSVTDAKPNTDLLVLSENGRGAERNRETREALEKRYPEIKGDELETLAATISVTFKDKEGKKVTNSRWILRAEAEDDHRCLFEELLKIRQLMLSGERTKLAVYPPGCDPRGENMRKMLEYVFRATNIKCLVYVKERALKSKTEERGTGGGKPRPSREKEVFILKQEGRSYNEILRSVKEAVLPKTEAAKAVRTLRSTRDGGMLIVLEKGMEENRELLKRELAKIHQGKIMERGGGTETKNYRVTEIDGETTKEEVASALNEILGEAGNDAHIDDLRPAFGGTQIATIRVGTEGAKKMEDTEKIRIGLSWCPVSERVDVLRCYKCWGYGHRSFECKAREDFSKVCMKCGGPGHIAKDCDGAEKCLTCKEEGHRAGSGRCPEFRKAVSRERLLRKRKRAY